MSDQDDATTRVGRLFDEIAADYDQSGVAFFAPIAEGLVDQLELNPGERVVDVGCGRGALTFPAADAVGPSGTVTAVDVAPAMVELTRRRAEESGHTQVRTQLLTPGDPGLPDASADVVAASLVLFFAPDPEATLRSWLRWLVPGGRIGISTFGDPDPTWKQVEALFRPHLPPQLLDARTTGAAGPFASDEGVEALFTACGVRDVRTVRRSLPVRFADAAAWRRFSMSTRQRAFWGFVPEDRREGLFREAAELLEGARTDDGDLVVRQDVRYTLGRR
ncbi:MAG TPA: methyltransferase domain-containing protein [Nocardioides sp.]|nr:methyltransferase domain-containing protein [Nocardioides sp.]